MNAGTLTQALTASRYKANPTAGSREKQDDTVSFMDMFAQNLRMPARPGPKQQTRKGTGRLIQRRRKWEIQAETRRLLTREKIRIL